MMGNGRPFPKTPAIDRFLSRVICLDEEQGGCWQWLGHLTRFGYGQIYRDDGTRTGTHRFAYEHFVGPIPEGLQLDHLCRNRGCANPDHLEPVTERENILRGISGAALNATLTHCKRGHEFNTENTHVHDGRRICRACRRLRWSANPEVNRARARESARRSRLKRKEAAG